MEHLKLAVTRSTASLIRSLFVAPSLILVMIASAWLAAQNSPAGPSDSPPNKPAVAATTLATVKKPAANNSRCLVCHVNFEDEELAVAHAKAGFGCVKCHGDSNAHASDEDNLTPPDTMYPKAKLNASCFKCHAKDQLSELHRPVLKGTDPKNKYCTDCHGEHRLNHRTRLWDKETGKLLVPKGGK